jgi:hypothetical protein
VVEALRLFNSIHFFPSAEPAQPVNQTSVSDDVGFQTAPGRLSKQAQRLVDSPFPAKTVDYRVETVQIEFNPFVAEYPLEKLNCFVGFSGLAEPVDDGPIGCLVAQVLLFHHLLEQFHRREHRAFLVETVEKSAQSARVRSKPSFNGGREDRETGLHAV